MNSPLVRESQKLGTKDISKGLLIPEKGLANLNKQPKETYNNKNKLGHLLIRPSSTLEKNIFCLGSITYFLEIFYLLISVSILNFLHGNN